MTVAISTGQSIARPDPNAPKIAFGSWAFSFGPFANDPWSFERVRFLRGRRRI
jgi:hypothetical protein